MHMPHRSDARRCTRIAPVHIAVAASALVLAFSIFITSVNAQQANPKQDPKAQASTHAAKDKTSEKPAATSGQQDPAGQGGSQEPFVMPDKPMCPCPLVTKDPVEPRFQEICGRCHTPDRITGTKKSGLEWKETIDKMILKGAQVGDNDYDVILAFLVRNFDRVDINWVESGELVLALGLTKEEAEKIVAYRKEHGDFKDFDALARVPGVDVKKLEAKKISIVFQ
jgi:competence ComEA-like helix-hairpin-helix protein